LDIGTSLGKWIGYEIIAVFFFSFPFMNSMNIVQGKSKPEDMASATSIIFYKLLLEYLEEAN